MEEQDRYIIDGLTEQERQAAAVRLELLGNKILSAARDELYMGMHFLDVALSVFSYQMDTGVSPFGTDGGRIYFHPQYLGGVYRQNRILVNRGYLHMVYHCIFRHMVRQGMDGRYWNLSCDIAAEHMIDGGNHRSIRFPRSLLRRETYRRLELTGKVLNAERIYVILQEWSLREQDLEGLEKEFYADDHRYWENQQPKQKPDPNLQRKWKDISEQMETDLETFSKEESEKSGDLLDQIWIENKERFSYREFLRKFAVFREEIAVDEDSFDYSFYSYGLRVYGNMPLIEPQETKEVKKISEFVVVIDTSMSCSGELVQKFLEETYSVLCEANSFFKKVNIHILQCDEKVHTDQKITCTEELAQYMQNLTLFGNGGTDFRPAFTYVNEMVERREFEDLRGLLYFTDGYGIYPQKMPAYKTAFVFMQEDYQDTEVPAWAIKLMMSEADLEDRESLEERHGY